MKAAVKSGQPPVAVIFNDESHREWTAWDYKLFKAYYIIEDWYREGIPLWWDESERVAFDVEARVSKSRAAIDRAQERAGKNKNTVHGRYFVANPMVIDGGDFPTREEWVAEQEAKRNNIKPVSKFVGPSDSAQIAQGRK